jgi:hypothetical protein
MRTGTDAGQFKYAQAAKRTTRNRFFTSHVI